MNVVTIRGTLTLVIGSSLLCSAWIPWKGLGLEAVVISTVCFQEPKPLTLNPKLNP